MNERYRKVLDRKSVNNDGFTRLHVVLEMLQCLLYEDPDEVAKIPLVGHCPRWGSYKMGYNDALEEAREVIHEDWVRVATVRWVELCLEKWEEWVSIPGPLRGGSQIGDLALEDVYLWVVRDNIKPQYVGSDCNRLTDRFLGVLSKMRDRDVNDQYILRWMGDIIARRSCTARPGDPHRDELTRDLLRAHYGLK
jgi:hypothetical protein